MNLEKIVCTSAKVTLVIGVTSHAIKLINRDIFPLVTHHCGDFTLVATPILYAGLRGPKVSQFFKERGYSLLSSVSKYGAEITAGLVTTYFVAAESGLDIMPLNSPDPKDIPASIIAGVSSYVLARRIQNIQHERYDRENTS